MKMKLMLAAAALWWAAGAAGEAAEPRGTDSGAEVFATHCATCHDTGVSHPGTLALQATRGREFAVLEERTDLTPDYVREIVRHGLRGMPPFRLTELSDAEVEAVARYIGKSKP